MMQWYEELQVLITIVNNDQLIAIHAYVIYFSIYFLPFHIILRKIPNNLFINI